MKEKTINILGIRKPKIMICRSNENRNPYNVYMEIISKEEEKAIDESVDENNELCFVRNNDIIAKGKDIILYGEVDLDNPKDLFYIKKFNLINEENSLIYSDLDFNTGIVKKNNGEFRKYITFNPIKWFKYNYILLGKPKRIIIYKDKSNKIYERNSKYYGEI